MAGAILFFLATLSMVTFGLQLPTISSDTRVQSGLGLDTLANHPDINSRSLAQAGTVALTTYATVYTNLTDTVYLVATTNNSLLNCKGVLWIHAHRNITSSPLGSIAADILLLTNLDTLGAWFNFTSEGYFFSIRLRQISNAQDIEEIAADVEIYEATIASLTAYTWVIEAVLGAIVATALVGRWKMQTVEK